MKKNLFSILLSLWSLVCFAQTETITVTIRKQGTAEVLYQAKALVNRSTYPRTSAGKTAFEAAASSGTFSLTTLDGCVIAAGTKPPLVKPTCVVVNPAPSWIGNLRYSYNSGVLYLENDGSIGRFKFERQDGQSFTTTNPDNVAIQSGTFYGYGDNPNRGSYTKQWRVNLPQVALKLTAEQAGASATYPYTLTPATAADKVQLTGTSSTTTTNPGSNTSTAPTDFDYPLPTAQASWPETNNTILNDNIGVGPVISRESSEIRKNWGGALQIYDKASSNRPLINFADHGREAENTLYGGPADFSRSIGGTWYNIGWDPITVGDDGHHGSPIQSVGIVTDKNGL